MRIICVRQDRKCRKQGLFLDYVIKYRQHTQSPLGFSRRVSLVDRFSFFSFYRNVLSGNRNRKIETEPSYTLSLETNVGNATGGGSENLVDSDELGVLHVQNASNVITRPWD